MNTDQEPSFWRGFSDSGNFPVNVWAVLTGLGAVATGAVLGLPFGRLIFQPGMAGFLGPLTLALLLLTVSLVPLYFITDLPMENGWRRAGAGVVMAGSLVLTYQYGGDLAAEIQPPDWKPLGYAAFFWVPNLTLGLWCMHERLDRFEPRQYTGPGVWAAIYGRIAGVAGGPLPGVWAVVRNRIMPAKGDKTP